MLNEILGLYINFDVYFGLHDCPSRFGKNIRVGRPNQEGYCNLQRLIFHDDDTLKTIFTFISPSREKLYSPSL